MRYPGQNREIEPWLRNINCAYSKEKDDEQIGGTDKRKLCAVCWPSGIVVASLSCC